MSVMTRMRHSPCRSTLASRYRLIRIWAGTRIAR
jgi:hypothetical protein